MLAWVAEPVWVLARMLVYPLRLLFRIKFSGRTRIPHTGPVLIAANHVSFLDPLLLLWLGERRLRRARFLAKAELWNVPVLRWLGTGDAIRLFLRRFVSKWAAALATGAGFVDPGGGF